MKIHPGIRSLLLGLCVPIAVHAGPGYAETQLQDDPPPIAIVNGESLYAEDLERVLATLHAGASVTERGSFDLDRLFFRVVSDALLSQEARALGLHEEEPIPTKLRLQRIGLAVTILEETEIWKGIEVSEEEIETEFQKAYRSVGFHVLTTREREPAEDARRELEEGEEFEQVARRVSIDQYSLRGGVVKSVHYIDLPAPISAELFQLQPGELAGPILSDLGWTVVRADSFTDADPDKYPIVRRHLERILRERKAEDARDALAAELRKTHEVIFDEEAEEAIGWERLQTSRIVAKIESPGTPIVTVGSQVITAMIYGNALNEEWKRIRNADTAMTRRELVLARLTREALFREEAIRRQYDRLPSVERKVRAKERELLVPMYLSVVLTPQVEIEPEELEVLYNENQELFRPAPELNVGQVTTTSTETANRVAELLRQGTDLSWLAGQYSVDSFKDSGGDRGWMTPVAGDEGLEDALLGAEVGDVVGPFEQGGQFVVAQVRDRKQPGPRPFSQVEGSVRSMAFRKKFQEVMDQHIQDLRAASEIEIYREVLDDMSITASPGSLDTGAADSGHGHGGATSTPPSEQRP